jgi:hypothetical protein
MGVGMSSEEPSVQRSDLQRSVEKRSPPDDVGRINPKLTNPGPAPAIPSREGRSRSTSPRPTRAVPLPPGQKSAETLKEEEVKKRMVERERYGNEQRPIIVSECNNKLDRLKMNLTLVKMDKSIFPGFIPPLNREIDESKRIDYDNWPNSDKYNKAQQLIDTFDTLIADYEKNMKRDPMELKSFCGGQLTYIESMIKSIKPDEKKSLGRSFSFSRLSLPKPMLGGGEFGYAWLIVLVVLVMLIMIVYVRTSSLKKSVLISEV